MSLCWEKNVLLINVSNLIYSLISLIYTLHSFWATLYIMHFKRVYYYMGHHFSLTKRSIFMISKLLFQLTIPFQSFWIHIELCSIIYNQTRRTNIYEQQSKFSRSVVTFRVGWKEKKDPEIKIVDWVVQLDWRLITTDNFSFIREEWWV